MAFTIRSIWDQVQYQPLVCYTLKCLEHPVDFWWPPHCSSFPSAHLTSLGQWRNPLTFHCTSCSLGILIMMVYHNPLVCNWVVCSPKNHQQPETCHCSFNQKDPTGTTCCLSSMLGKIEPIWSMSLPHLKAFGSGCCSPFITKNPWLPAIVGAHLVSDSYHRFIFSGFPARSLSFSSCK